MEEQNSQVDAILVIEALTLEIAALTRRAVIAEQRVAVLAQRRVQADGLPAVLLDLDDLLRGHVQLCRTSNRA